MLYACHLICLCIQIEALSATNRQKLQSLAPVKRKKRKNTRTNNRNKAATTVTADNGRRKSSSVRKNSTSEATVVRRSSSRKNSDVNTPSTNSGVSSAKKMTIDTTVTPDTIDCDKNTTTTAAADSTAAQSVSPTDIVSSTSSSRRTKVCTSCYSLYMHVLLSDTVALTILLTTMLSFLSVP
jgi:hypothetical protein